MDFSKYERYVDYGAACEGEYDRENGMTEEAEIGELWREALQCVEENFEALERMISSLSQSEPPLRAHARERFLSVREQCERLARIHRGRLCARIDVRSYRASVSLYVPLLSVSSPDLIEILRLTDGVAMTACEGELAVLFSVPFFESTVSPLDRAMDAVLGKRDGEG